jgi:hypothetical protein
MPFTDWKVYIKANVDEVPDVYGVYETSNSKTDSSQITYIGCGEIHNELSHHLNDSCVGPSTYFRYEQTFFDKIAQARERALLQEFREKHGRLPICNIRIG